MHTLTKRGPKSPAGRLPTVAAAVAPEEEPPRDLPAERSQEGTTMPAKKNKQQDPDTPAIADIPRVGFSCSLYLDGHSVHYIPVTRLAPTLEPVPATLRMDGDEITLVIDRHRTRVHSHNPAGIGLLISEFGAKCRWYPTLRLACWPRPTERHWVSLALDPIEPCISAEDAYLAEVRHWS